MTYKIISFINSKTKYRNYYYISTESPTLDIYFNDNYSNNKTQTFEE